MGELQEKAVTAQADQPLMKNGAAAPGSSPHGRLAAKRWWFVEIWAENREAFKALVVHTIFFALLIEILAGLALRIEHSGLPPERKAILEAIDFYLTAIALVVFGFDFIVKILIHFWRGNQQEEKR